MEYACLQNQKSPLGLAVKRSNKLGGSRVFLGGGAIVKLQMIDPGLVGKEFRLVAARLLAQRARGTAALAELDAGGVEVALVDQRKGLLANDSKLRAIIGALGELLAKLDQLVRNGIQLRRDFVIRHAFLAELFQNRMQWFRRDAFLLGKLGDLVTGLLKLFLERPMCVCNEPSGLLLVQTDLDARTGIIGFLRG